MKKIIMCFFLSFLVSICLNAQQKDVFTFVKSSALNLEKRAKYNDDGRGGSLFSTPILKKRMLGMFKVDDITDSIDYNSGKYLIFSLIPITDKFEMITDDEFGSSNWEGDLFIQNIVTKQKYAVMVFPIRTFQDFSNMGNELNGNGWLTRFCPKELSQDEKIILAKYKALIVSANANIAVLLAIQKRYITDGYFDSDRISSSDKITFNRNITALKLKAEQLSDIDKYEDKDDKLQDRLSISELGSLSNISDWNFRVSRID